MASSSSSKTSPPAKGLFLNLSEDFEFGRVKLGSGSTFDVIPAQTMSGSDVMKMAMTIKDDWAIQEGKQWVFFSPLQGGREVVLIDRLSEGCFFTELNVKKDGRMKLVVENEGGEFQLRMQGNRIRDFDDGDAESSEVSMEPYPGKLKNIDVREPPVDPTPLRLLTWRL